MTNKVKNLSYLAYLLMALVSTKAMSYPHYIRLGYVSCTGCHYAPEGGGLLTPYGQGIAQTFSLPGGELQRSEAGTIKKFLTANGKLHHSIQARYMGLQREKKVNNKRQRFFPMQFDYLNQVDWSSNIRHEIVLAVAPSSASNPTNQDTQTQNNFSDRLYFRSLKLEWKINKYWRLAAGQDNLPLGLRLIDHTAYIRERNRLGVTDVPTQLQLSFDSSKLRVQSALFAPNNNDLKYNRETGAMALAEYSPFKGLALGLQGLLAEGKTIDRKLVGALVRAGTEDFSILGELDFTRRYLETDKIDFDQWASYLEFALYPLNYLKFFVHLQQIHIQQPFKEKEHLNGIGTEIKWHRYLASSLETRLRSAEHRSEGQILAQMILNLW